ncbi:MAG: acireductone synthase [Xanthomonadales bacterium]|nr:acireductone synthase [Xanthomonadales bacterium]
MATFRPQPITALVTDVEGTTSAIDYVHRVLFPYSREALPDFLDSHQSDPAVTTLLQQLREEVGADADPVQTLRGWIDADVKHPVLKALQGMIWQEAFEQHGYRSHVYPDAVHQLQRWHAAGLPLHVYSSGSIQAQRLYFRHTEAGDLGGLFQRHFDTSSGPKREAESYRRIAADLALPPAGLLFLSDVEAELDAARAAGWQTLLVARASEPTATRHPWVSDFDQIDLDAAFEPAN